jgi:hypothetical protein
MHTGTKLALAAMMTVMASGPTFASFWQCVPEIDGAAGVSVLALIGCLAAIAHNRLAIAIAGASASKRRVGSGRFVVVGLPLAR